MSRFRRASVLLPGLLLFASPARAGEVIERILVRVNSRIITQSLLDGRVEQTSRDAGVVPDPARREELKKSVLAELVNEALLEDRARDLDLITTDAEIEEQIKRLKEQNNVSSDEEFATALLASGLTPDRLREQLRKSLTVQRVVGREVNSKIDLSDDALRLIYEREKETWLIPEQLHVAEILIPKDENAGAAERRAQEAVTKVRGGVRFEDAVKEYSQGPTKGRGGDLGTVAKGELNAEIDKVVFSLPAGAVSDPIATRLDWHVVKVLEKIPASYKPFNAVKAEILKREQETQFQKKLAEYLDKLRRDAVIRVSEEASPYYSAPPAVPAVTAPVPPASPKKAKKS